MFNPAEASENIKTDFINFLTSNFYISDEEYRNEFTKELSKDKIIANGPFININNPFEIGESIEELYIQGILCKEFQNLEPMLPEQRKSLPLKRGLYKHQVNAINVITTKQKNAVITTGTGSGKTECFLIPVLNELLKEKEAGTLQYTGVRAILIYPMTIRMMLLLGPVFDQVSFYKLLGNLFVVLNLGLLEFHT